MIYMVKLQKNKGQYFITIPKDIIEDKGWENAEEFIWQYSSSGDIILKEKNPHLEGNKVE